jgi:hypothetical protein
MYLNKFYSCLNLKTPKKQGLSTFSDDAPLSNNEKSPQVEDPCSIASQQSEHSSRLVGARIIMSTIITLTRGDKWEGEGGERIRKYYHPNAGTMEQLQMGKNYK